MTPINSSNPELINLADPNQRIPAHFWRAQTFDDYRAEKIYQTALKIDSEGQRIERFEQAAKLGSSKALKAIVACAIEKLNREDPALRDRPGARRLIKKAIELGSADALYAMAQIVIHEGSTVSHHRDYVHLLTQAAQKGDPDARCSLGKYYLCSDQPGAAQDVGLALDYLHSVADQEAVRPLARYFAARDLGDIYCTGAPGMEPDLEQAAYYAKLADVEYKKIR